MGHPEEDCTFEARLVLGNKLESQEKVLKLVCSPGFLSLQAFLDDLNELGKIGEEKLCRMLALHTYLKLSGQGN